MINHESRLIIANQLLNRDFTIAFLFISASAFPAISQINSELNCESAQCLLAKDQNNVKWKRAVDCFCKSQKSEKPSDSLLGAFQKLGKNLENTLDEATCRIEQLSAQVESLPANSAECVCPRTVYNPTQQAGNYAACARDIIDDISGLPGIQHIGGPNRRCVDSPNPATIQKYQQLRNIHSNGIMESYREAIFRITGGQCIDPATNYVSAPSSHATGRALDLFLRPRGNFRRADAPDICEQLSGDEVASHFIQYADRYGIQHVIFNRRQAEGKNGWVWTTYQGSSPHYDHVHVECQ